MTLNVKSFLVGLGRFNDIILNSITFLNKPSHLKVLRMYKTKEFACASRMEP